MECLFIARSSFLLCGLVPHRPLICPLHEPTKTRQRLRPLGMSSFFLVSERSNIFIYSPCSPASILPLIPLAHAQASQTSLQRFTIRSRKRPSLIPSSSSRFRMIPATGAPHFLQTLSSPTMSYILPRLKNTQLENSQVHYHQEVLETQHVF